MNSFEKISLSIGLFALAFSLFMCYKIKEKQREPAIQKRCFYLLLIQTLFSGISTFLLTFGSINWELGNKSRWMYSTLLLFMVLPLWTVFSFFKNISLIELSNCNSLGKKNKVSKLEVLFLTMIGLKGTTKNPIKRILTSFFLVFVFEVFFVLVLAFLYHFTNISPRTIGKSVTVPLTLFLIILNIIILTQFSRVSKIQDSYQLRNEFSINCISTFIHLILYSLIFCTIFFNITLKTKTPKSSIQCFCFAVTILLSNLSSFFWIFYSIQQKKGAKMTLDEFSTALKNGFLEKLRGPLHADFCMELYNFLNELEYMRPHYLVETYIREGSKQELNISKEARQAILKTKNLQKQDFNLVYREVIELIYHNTLSRL